MLALTTLTLDCDRTCKVGHWCRFNRLFALAGITTRVHSHIARVQTVIRDLDMLESACRLRGLELVRGQTSYRWYGRSVGDYALPEGYTVEQLGRCTHAIRVPGNRQAYEIGVVARPNGDGFDLLWDFYQGGGGLESLVGKDCGGLLEAYHFGAVEQAALQLGWLAERTDAGLVVYHPAGGTVTLGKDATVQTAGFVGAGCHEARKQLGIRVEEGSIHETAECAAAVAKVNVPA